MKEGNKSEEEYGDEMYFKNSSQLATRTFPSLISSSETQTSQVLLRLFIIPPGGKAHQTAALNNSIIEPLYTSSFVRQNVQYLKLQREDFTQPMQTSSAC